MRQRKKKLNKISSKTIVLIILIVFFLTISVGYSYLKQSLSLSGKSTIVQQGSSDYEDGNSTYTWEVTNSWTQGGSSLWACDISITVVNMDQDIDIWEIAFDIPPNYNEQQSNIWVASSKIFENGRLTLVGFDYEPVFEKGTSKTIKFHLAFDEEPDMYIENLTLNGFRATLE